MTKKELAAKLATKTDLSQAKAMEVVNAVYPGARERSGCTLVPTDARGLAKLLKSVKRGQISGILPDQSPDDLASGENSPFMGIDCFTPTLACNMLRRISISQRSMSLRPTPKNCAICRAPKLWPRCSTVS